MKERLTIAMDGPAGSGKSTIAQRLAEELDYLYSKFRFDVSCNDAFIPPEKGWIRRTCQC